MERLLDIVGIVEPETMVDMSGQSRALVRAIERLTIIDPTARLSG